MKNSHTIRKIWWQLQNSCLSQIKRFKFCANNMMRFMRLLVMLQLERCISVFIPILPVLFISSQSKWYLFIQNVAHHMILFHTKSTFTIYHEHDTIINYYVTSVEHIKSFLCIIVINDNFLARNIFMLQWIILNMFALSLCKSFKIDVCFIINIDFIK